MPSISYNGQSFVIDGRRFWVLGASIQYARVPAALWASRIAAAKQAGFNTIETACPWLVHEGRKGRFAFEGDFNLQKFVQMCAAAGMRVILRVGPFIGSQFDGGGLPGWLIETPGIRIRENNPVFLEHVSRYFRKLLSEVADLQVTTGGPIMLVQSEHAWTCSNDAQGQTYLNTVTRIIRESGITVPVINANDLWLESPGTIDTWRGYDHLLVHLRQLRTLQPDAPRLVSDFEVAAPAAWGNAAMVRRTHAAAAMEKTAGDALRKLAQILASGAQPVVSPFHAGTNFDFLGGRSAGGQDGFVATSGAIDAPISEAGGRSSKYHAMRRLATFANHFGHVFAELETDYQPIVLDPESMEGHRAARPSRTPRAAGAASVVPVRGPQGRIVFVFSGNEEAGAAATLVLDDGVRLPVLLGDQSVGWFALDVDLQGIGRLDYSNICPWGMVDRSLVVFQGPARAAGFISISGTPLDVTVPADDGKPLVAEHMGLTIVVCNQRQIDATYHDEHAVYVGIGGFNADGSPRRDPRFAKSYVIRRDGKLSAIEFGAGAGPSGKRSTARRGHMALNRWQAATATAYVTGESPRYASLEGPESLSACGASLGYGWYRVTLNGAGKKLCHLPEAADRVHVFVDGKRQRLFGVGPGADPRPFELRMARGPQTLVALVDNLGRFFEGNDIHHRKGLWGHLYAVKPLRSVRPKLQEARPINPFELRGFISGRDASQLSDSAQAVWRLSHTRKSPILIDINGAQCSGTFVLNDQPIAYYAGASGGCLDRILLDPKTTEPFKKGKNIIRFAPDPQQHDAAREVSKCTMLYECTEALTASATWAFAKWEPPATSVYAETDKAQSRQFKGKPCWWRTTVQIEPTDRPVDQLAFWLDTAGLSKGQAYVNGHNLGRFFTATGSGQRVGPQTRLHVPAPWLKFGHVNELVMFDEHGFDPSRVKLSFDEDVDRS